MRILLGAMSVALLAGCGGDVGKAHQEVKKYLNDGATAEFRADQVLYLPPDGQKMVCGEVNAKNAFGAYAGFTPYVVERLDSSPHAIFSAENLNDIRITCSLGKGKK